MKFIIDIGFGYQEASVHVVRYKHHFLISC